MAESGRSLSSNFTPFAPAIELVKNHPEVVTDCGRALEEKLVMLLTAGSAAPR